MLTVLCNEILTALKNTGAKPHMLGVPNLLVPKMFAQPRSIAE